MRPSGHRLIGALALLMVVLVGASIFLPLVVVGQTHQVQGRVRICPSLGFVPTATVTLTDVNGINPPRTTSTDLGGVYQFVQPPTGSYSVTANRSGYFPSGPSNPVRFDGTQTVSSDVCMHPHGTPPKVLAVTVTGNGGSPVPGATVTAFSPTNPTGRIQLVATGTTGSTGIVNLTLWPAVFSVRASASTLQTVEASVDVAAVAATTISLAVSVELFGHVRDVDSGNFLRDGVVAWLYNPAQPNTSAARLIPATAKDSLFEFEDARVPAGTYTIIVDAKGYLAHTNTIVLSGAPTPYDVDLKSAPHERFTTTVLYGTQDWNNLTIWRNLTLNPDGTLSGLSPLNLRDLRLQIDATPGLGDGDGLLEAGEITAFKNWVTAKGPGYVTTEGFLTTNGKAYNSTAAFSPTVEGLETAGARIWINGSGQYRLKQTPPPYIPAGAKTYFVNVTMVPDVDVPSYQNFTYTIALPRTYELNTSTVLPAGAPVTTRNFTRFTIDPGVTTGQPQIRMTISQSLNGTARAKVVAPVGKFHVVNSTFANYLAFVMNNTAITYSAEDSTDPNGHVPDGNYTWRFNPGPADTRYGIRANYTFTQNGTFTVNLTVREAGGNVTFRSFTIVVDDRPPVANIQTNRTGSGIANGLTLRVNEDIPIRFDGLLSTDIAYPGKPGFILDAGYSWDFDGNRISDRTGRIVNHSFATPGRFTVNLTVTDSVGWKSTNATMIAIVNDTTASVPAFDILDPSREWAVITSPIERRTIALNASRTTDNYDRLANLTFTWTIPGPVIGRGVNITLTGVNVSFAWEQWNASYRVQLSVKDTGFPGPPHQPNTGNLTRDTLVQIDTTIHADLRFEPNTLKVSPADPEEGADVTVVVNVTNKQDRAVARNVTAELNVISGGQTTALPIIALHWFDRNGASKDDNRSIAPMETVKLVFTTRFSGQGNKTLQVNVFDSTEPTTWRNDNRPTTTVNVRQPFWQPYAIIAAVVGIIALFVGGMYARRKIKAGEWRPIRGRRREKVGGEERPRKEVKEEKKRL